MRTCLVLFTSLSLLLVSSNNQVLATVMNATDSATVSATVPEDITTNPILLSPADSSTTNDSHTVFIFQAATSTNGIDHYDLYVDDQIAASNIGASTLSQDSTTFTATQSENIFRITLKSALTDAYHSWKVVATRHSELTLTSDTWHFWVDTIAPAITLEKIDSLVLKWNSENASSFPALSRRDLVVTNHSPILSGKVEPHANLKITLLCPRPVGKCKGFTTTINLSTGIWNYRPQGLIARTQYTAYLSATDAAGNTTTFPQFTLTYAPRTPLIGLPAPIPLALIVTPLPSPTLSPTPTPTLPPTAEPTPLVPLPPDPPKSPPPPAPIQTTDNTEIATQFSLIAALLTLLHVSLATLGVTPSASLVLPFFASLLIPPIGKRNNDLTLFFDDDNGKGSKPLPYTSIFAYSLDSLRDRLGKLTSIEPGKLFSTLAPILKYPTASFISGSTGLFNLNLRPGLFLLRAQRSEYRSPLENVGDRQSIIDTNVILYHSEIIDVSTNPLTKDMEVNNSLINLNSTDKVFLFPLKKNQLNQGRSDHLKSLAMDLRLYPLLSSLIFSTISLYSTPSFIGLSIFLVSSVLLANQYLYPIVKSREIAIR